MKRTIPLALLTISAVLTLIGLFKVLDSFILPVLFGQPVTESLNPPLVIPNIDSVPSVLYAWSPYIAAGSWIFVAAVMWRGHIRKMWQMQGYDYEAFRVFTRMRGSKTRLKILQNLQIPKNRLQIATELDMHWESIDNHIEVLIRYGLIEEAITYGTAKYLVITEKGKQLVALLAHDPDLQGNINE